MGRRIGGDEHYGVAAVGQQARVERVEAIGQVTLQQQPARFAVAAVISGVDELIVVVIVRRPANAD
jgi:hypothetical protein